MRSVFKRFNPINWSNRTIRVWMVVFYLILLPSLIIFNLEPVGATEEYTISGKLSIPSVSIESPVTTIELSNNVLPTPSRIVGSFSNHKNKTLLVAHSTAAFSNLKNVIYGTEINYNDENYVVTKIVTEKKSDVKMNELLDTSQKPTIVLMTCAGKLLSGGDATHRLIVTAVKTN